MSKSKAIMELDGRTLEGGGQLLRIALCLSCLTSLPIHITHIRGKRGGVSASGEGKAGGLKPAHLAAAIWLAKATAATTRGLDLRSTDLIFQPTRRICDDETINDQNVWTMVYEDGQLIRRETHIPMSTTGSTLLILQAIFPFLLFLRSAVPLRVTIQGGTNVTGSLSIEYISQVFLPLISTKLNIPPVKVNVHRRGWNYGSNEAGEVSFDIEPLREGTIHPALHFTDRGVVEKVHVSIIAPSGEIRDQLRTEALTQASKALPETDIFLAVDEDSGNAQRVYLLLVVETSSRFRLGRDCLSCKKISKKSRNKQQKNANEYCRGLVSSVIKDIQKELSFGGCVDEHMEDQLAIFEALAHGESEVEAGKGREPSLHAQTAQWVATRILGASFEDGKCNGVGFRAREKKPETSETAI